MRVAHVAAGRFRISCGRGEDCVVACKTENGTPEGMNRVVGGYCPGTSVAAAATGRLDGLSYLLGVGAGTLLFAGAFPAIKGLYYAGEMGVQTLPGVLHLPYGLVVFAVVLMAVGGFAGATWVEHRRAATHEEE